MADHPILFSAPMVRAIIAGRKTQTRRVIGRLRGVGAVTEFGPSTTQDYAWHFRDKGMRWHDLRHDELMGRLPHQVGDRLWVREAWGARGKGLLYPGRKPTPDDQIIFRADPGAIDTWGGGLPWRPSIHMPRWGSRLTLGVVEVRVQRLQDISEADAVAEGVSQFAEEIDRQPWGAVSEDDRRAIVTMTYGSGVKAFSHLWEHVNGAGAWDRNPWVVAYTFDVNLCNIDRMAKDAS